MCASNSGLGREKLPATTQKNKKFMFRGILSSLWLQFDLPVTKLIYSTRVLAYQIFKLVFCRHKKLRLNVKILSYGINDITFP